MKGRKTAEDALSSHAGIHVIIVNYGTADLALGAAASALAQSVPRRDVHVHLLDNASPGDDATLLRDEVARRNWQDRVTLWVETCNHGFGRGNNIVLSRLLAQAAPETLVLLLNPDATLTEGALARLAALLDLRQDVAAVGAGIALPDGRPVPAAFRFPSPLGEFEAAASFGPLTRLLARHRIALPPDHAEGPVDWVAGAAVLFRLSALRRTGLFDPGFFLYYEEVELMHRLSRLGLRTWYLPSARATHSEGAATGLRPGQRRRRPPYWFHSWQHYHRLVRGRPAATLTALLHLTGAILNRVQSLLRATDPAHPERYIRDFAALSLLPLLTGRKPARD